jgi:uroporphyrin-III C-methyltransferase
VKPAGSLLVVGTGIRLGGQITSEALDHIRRAERLFYLSGDLAAARWLGRLNPHASNLFDCYAEGRPRLASYAEMVERVLTAVREGHQVVAAFYGHPGVGVNPSHEMIRRARDEGYPARMLPGISSEACLIADLGIDPLKPGWQSYEAWAFLAHRPRFDPRFSLVLWQVGLIYQSSISFSGVTDARGLRDLARLLRRHYPSDHEAILYEASPFPIADPRVEGCALAELAAAKVSTSTTLYLPPLTRPR